MIRKIVISSVLFLLISALATAAIVNIPDDFATIQAGVDSSGAGDTILVQPNVYHENIVVDDHPVTLASLFLTTGDTSYISSTVLDGSSVNSVISLDTWQDSLSAVIGFSIVHGGNTYGGGGVSTNASSTIRNNIIELNSATRGGGVYSTGNTLIKDNIIRTNQASVAGGAIITYGGHPVIENNLIINNISEVYTGGIHIETSQWTIIRDNTILGNVGTSLGGAIVFYTENEGGEISGNLIAGNGSFTVGALSLSFGVYDIFNNTICNNLSLFKAIQFLEYCEADFINNIVWDNVGALDIDTSADVSVTYSDIQGGYAGEGNIESYPLFVDTANADYHLQLGSPCIDTGDPDWPMDPDSSRADMGAFYYDHMSGIEDYPGLPRTITLYQNYPNPFNLETVISFELPIAGPVTLDIYDLLGRKVSTLVNTDLTSGSHEIKWHADNLASGMYFYRLQAGAINVTKKLTLLK